MSNLLLGLDYIWFPLMGFRFLGKCVSHDLDFDWVFRVQSLLLCNIWPSKGNLESKFLIFVAFTKHLFDNINGLMFWSISFPSPLNIKHS